MASLTEKNVREKLVEKLNPILAPVKFLKRNPYSRPRDKWVGVFATEDDDEIVVHAWFIRRIRLIWSIDNSVDTEPWAYQLMGFSELIMSGDTVNSEDTFQASLDAVVNALKTSDESFWNFVSTDDEVVVTEIAFDPIGIIKSGNSSFLHSASGRLNLNITRC